MRCGQGTEQCFYFHSHEHSNANMQTHTNACNREVEACIPRLCNDPSPRCPDLSMAVATKAAGGSFPSSQPSCVHMYIYIKYIYNIYTHREVGRIRRMKYRVGLMIMSASNKFICKLAIPGRTKTGRSCHPPLDTRQPRNSKDTPRQTRATVAQTEP